MKKTILFAIVSMFLMSCGHHRDGTSIWAEGGWIIPLIPAIGAVLFFISAYRSSKSGSNPYDAGGKLRKDIETGNVPMYKTWQFLFAVALTLATIGIIVWQNAEK